MTRALGLDLGTKTIGLALSDELHLTAQGHSTLQRTSMKKDLDALGAVCREHDVTQLVLGLPLNMDGSEGPRAVATRKFGEAAATTLALPVDYCDERLTTVSAERVLLEADLSREKRRRVVDQVAATIILQAWLDARRPAPQG